MLRQLHQPNLLCVSSYTQPKIISIREKSKFRGKKDKKWDTVKWQHNNVPLQPHEDFEPDEWLPRRLTYFPDGLWSSLVPRPKPAWYVDRHKPMNIKTLDPPEKEWNDVAVYPEIIKDPWIRHPFQTSYLGRTKWYKELAEIPSVDERNIALTKITRQTLHFNEPYFNNFGGLEIAQNITRTHLVDGNLPESYVPNDVDENLVNKIIPLLLDVIRVNKYQSSRTDKSIKTFGDKSARNLQEERIKEVNLLQEVNSLVFNALVPNSPHLLDLHVDIETRARSWWYASQLPLPKQQQPMWIRRKYKKIDQLFSYECVNPLSIRTSAPLPRIVSGSDDLSSSAEIPELKYHPTRLGYRFRERYLPSMPGFWPPRNFDPSTDEADDFPYLTMFGKFDLAWRKHLNSNQDFGDDEEVIKCKAILGSFGWLNGLSFNHGFTPFHEITYPFVNQGLVTDGQKWHFFVYQMNAHTFHSDIFDGEGPRNICWISPEIKLYESYQDGQFTGVNSEVVKHLIKMYSKVPIKEENVNYRPLVGKDERTSEQIDATRKLIGFKANQRHDRKMKSYKFARRRELYHQIFVQNPNYDTTFMRVALRPRLKPAEDYYYQWKY